MEAILKVKTEKIGLSRVEFVYLQSKHKRPGIHMKYGIS